MLLSCHGLFLPCAVFGLQKRLDSIRASIRASIRGFGKATGRVDSYSVFIISQPLSYLGGPRDDAEFLLRGD